MAPGMQPFRLHPQNSPLHQLGREESRLAIRGNPQNRIRKQKAPRGPKTGKFDYLSPPGHSACSMASEFFTDDEIAPELTGHGLPLGKCEAQPKELPQVELVCH